MKIVKRANLLVVVLFATGISMPAVQQITDLVPDIEVVDNRTLAPFPPVAPERRAIIEFPARFDAWFADNMGLRGHLVSGYRVLTDAVLRSPDKVIVGQAGWLYLRRGVREDIETVPLLRDWCGRYPFTDRQIDRWVETIAANHDWLSARGIAYLFVVPPNKMTVIPQYLPDQVACRRGPTRLTQLNRALVQRKNLEIVDLQEPLRRAVASGQPIWFRTDTHWNARGMRVAYESVMGRIKTLLPDAGRIPRFKVRELGRSLGDLGRMVGGGQPKPDVLWSVTPANTRSQAAKTPFPDMADTYGRRSSARFVDDNLPRAMVFHDSFFEGAMNDFLAESFSRTVYVFHGRPEINRQLVEREQPDIVVHEMVERNLLHPFFPR